MQERDFGLSQLAGAEDIGRYDQSQVVFRVDNKLYGVPTTSVREITDAPRILSLPQLPHSLLGVCRYRDRVIPVLNLPFLLGLSEAVESPQMLVLAIEGRTSAILVEDVTEILNFQTEEIEPNPFVETVENESFFIGVKRCDEDIVTLLSLGTMFDYSQIADQVTTVVEENSSSDDGSRVAVMRLGDIRVGVEINQIKRIIRVPEISELDDSPPCIKGVALKPETTSDKAGEEDYYPVVNLFYVMDQPETEGKRTILLSESLGITVGYFSGPVEEILTVPERSFKRFPPLAHTADNEFIQQILLHQEDIILVADLDKILYSYGLVEA